MKTSNVQSAIQDQQQAEIASGQRFEFGENWRHFLAVLTDDDCAQALRSMLTMLGDDDLSGLSFLDIGSGSGLSSLCARRAGARVVSFDYDTESVSCTFELRRREQAGDRDWRVVRGSALDADFLDSLGKFDIVYSWGVLHHTGDMWTALEYAASRVNENGCLFVALYNDQGWISKYWLRVKQIYNRSFFGRILMLAVHLPYFALARVAGSVRRFIRQTSRDDRGMNFYRDVVDWVGGLPFEVASADQVMEFLSQRGFSLVRIATVGRRHGCNQFVFRRHKG